MIDQIFIVFKINLICAYTILVYYTHDKSYHVHCRYNESVVLRDFACANKTFKINSLISVDNEISCPEV